VVQACRIYITLSKIINTVMFSAADAKLAALYVNASKGVEILNILQEMGHPQPPQPHQIDNSTAKSNINSQVQPKCTSTMGIRFHLVAVSTKTNSDYSDNRAKVKSPKVSLSENSRALPKSPKFSPTLSNSHEHSQIPSNSLKFPRTLPNSPQFSRIL
jgi:hypothetical protein